MAGAPLLTLRRIRKRFGRLEVLHGVDLDLLAGEVLVLAGANGAGKSTLVKILAGVYDDWEGEMTLDGRSVRPRSPHEAAALGVSCIHQELALVGPMSVTDNLFLGRERCRPWGGVDARAQARMALGWLDRLGLDVDVSRPVEELPIALQQSIEIARALSMDARVLVMDEPTSALSEMETRHLFERVEQLKREGHSVLFISHKMEEIYRIADRIAVLRDGLLVGTRPALELGRDQIVEWMAGRSLQPHVRAASVPKAPRLSVEGLTVANPARPDRPWARDVSFEVRRGEVLGLVGLAGSGASEILGATFGRIRARQGRVRVDGALVPPGRPAAALRRGLAFLTSDRKAEGLTPPRSVVENVTLATLPRFSPLGWLRPGREEETVRVLARELELQAPSLQAAVDTLSGGNQQKALLARLWLTEPKVLLLDEPTRGVDVAAKARIHRLIDEWTEAGCAIALTSSELPELLALADRVLVLHRGEVQVELGKHESTAERVIAAALGGAAT
ncbi:MAG TPA: sugar ABC transporter ATP-binding protein [Vicinamibacteria bacterium]|nr:sugar ABC transporter ATP-binding protein [Vicinamibacteria bacterium]